MTDAATVNVAKHLGLLATSHPDMPAVHLPAPGASAADAAGQGKYLTWTYAQLEAQSNRLARALQAHGIERGMRTVLMVTPSYEFFLLVFALFKIGAVMVAVDPGIGIRNLGTCLGEAQPQAFIGIPKAHLARRLLGWARDSIRLSVNVGGWFGPTLKSLQKRQLSDAPLLADSRPDEMAAILFTSGSTGVPKGVVYSHGNFAAQVHALQQTYAIAPGEIDLCTFPLFALYAPALGMSAVVPVMDFTRPGSVAPMNIIGPVQRFDVTNLFGSPALLNRVGRFAVENNLELPSLRRVISAGAPVPAAVIERFTRLLNADAQVFTPYGATESLPVASLGSRVILSETAPLTAQGRGVCVGEPVPMINAKVIRVSDEPIARWSDDLVLPTGHIGEIAVQGPMVTASYYRREQSTALAKIADPDSPFGFWHRMGDLGYQDELGRLWFCGRKSQRVVLSAGVLHTVCCEGIFNQHPQVFRTALVQVDDEPVLCVELEAEARSADQKQVESALLEIGRRHPITAGIRRVLFHPSFPVDIRHNAKIGREKLALWARGKLR